MDVLNSATKIHAELEGQIGKIKTIQQRSDGKMNDESKDLLCKLTETNDETKKMIEKIRNLVESDLEEKRILEKQIKDLQQQLLLYRENIAKLTKDNEKFETKLAAMQSDLAATQSDLAVTQSDLAATQSDLAATQSELAATRSDLAKKQSELAAAQTALAAGTDTKMTELESALHTGQIAYNFENDLAKYIYPASIIYGSQKIFTTMKQWLDHKQDSPEWQEANAKWISLKEQGMWMDEYDDIFVKFVKSRIKIAHPKIKRNAVQLETRPEPEKRCIEAMLRITKLVNVRMKERFF